MNSAQKILMIMGAAYIAVGTVVFLVLAGSGMSGPFAAIPLLFVALGIAFVAGVLISRAKKKNIVAKGKKYAAKIYGYVDNTAYLVNGSYTVNVKVHYFDEKHMEKEAIIPTGFEKGSGMYPIGMTIDIYEYRGKFGYDPASVRNEILPDEDELMDSKPVSPEKLRSVAVICPSCGASFQAHAGYSSRCPYCGGYQNTAE